MADIFEEVEEGLRQDKLTGLWKKYGVFAYLAGALIIGGVALNEYLKIQSDEAETRDAARLESALNEVEARNYEIAATQLTGIMEDGIAPANIAAHYLAGVRLDGNGDAGAAASVLAGTVGDAADPTQKLALIKSAYLQADTFSRAELEAMLMPLAEDDGPFGALAKELIAAKALQDGDVSFARREFSYLRLAQNVPPGVVTRATQALEALPPASETETTPAVEPETEESTDPASAETTEESTE